MKICPFCRCQNSDTNMYCTFCGKPLSQLKKQDASCKNPVQNPGNAPEYSSEYSGNLHPYTAQSSGPSNSSKKTGRKKTAAILCTVTAVMLGLGAATAYLYTVNQPTDKTTEASRAQSNSIVLQQSEISEAERSYFKAIEEDPQDPEPYSDLYAFYIEENRLEDGCRVQQQAEEQLEKSSLVSFYNTVNQLDKENQLVQTSADPVQKQKYLVVTEVTGLNRTPESLLDEVWLIEKSGRFSFIDPQGSQVSESTGLTAMVLDFRQTNSGVMACIDDSNLAMASSQNQYPPNPNTQYSYCSGLGAATNAVTFYLDENDQLQRDVKYPENYDDLPEWPNQPILVNYKDTYTAPYYIYNPSNNMTYGPYSENYPGCIAQAAKKYPARYTHFTVPVPYTNNQPVGGPFWVSHDGQVSIYSADGAFHADNFDKAELIDRSSMAGFKGGRISVIDEHADFVYAGAFDAVGTAINNIAPVRIDGTWYLIDLDPAPSALAQSEQEQKSGSDMNSAVERTSVAAEEKIIAMPADAVHNYGYFPYSGKVWTGFEIQSDGGFTYYRIIENAMQIDDEYFNTKEKTTLEGKLEAIETADGVIRFRIVQMEHTLPLGYLETESNGIKVYEVDLPDVTIGTEILYYPKGTPWNQIDEKTRERLMTMQEPPVEGQPLNGAAIRINESDQVFQSKY